MSVDSLAIVNAMDDLHDIVEPAAVSMMPETIGWTFVAALGVLALLWLAWRVHRHRRLTRYRRDALTALEQIERQANGASKDSTAPVLQVAELLKRTAISGYGRQRVASLTGEPWLRFLDETSHSKEFATQGQVLTEYSSAPVPAESLRSLLQLARSWIRGHDVRV